MPSRPRNRILFDSCITHKVWRGHNREWVLHSEVLKQKYLDLLADSMNRVHTKDIVLKAICVMANHSHEIFSIPSVKNFSSSMRIHHSNFGKYFNRKMKRSGKVAESRPHTTCFEEDAYTREAVFYVHANPIKAGIKDERAYLWSTHKYYAYGQKPGLLKGIHFEFPDWYLNYGTTMRWRQRKYRKEFQAYLMRSRDQSTCYSRVFFEGSPVWKYAFEESLRSYFRKLTEKRKLLFKAPDTS